MEEGSEGIFGVGWKTREKGFGEKKINGIERVKMEGENGGLGRGNERVKHCCVVD